VNGSLKIGTAFGIPIRVHWTFLVLLLPLVGSPWAWTVVPALFGSVLLHELGHGVVARSYGIRVVDITLWPLGGLARMSEIPEVPRVEGMVAIAGPMVNFALAAAGLILAMVLRSLGLAAAAHADWFTSINLLLGAFNLVPAFPMDGGRLLRAWLGRSTDWVTATQQAVAVGRVFAGIMLVGSVVSMFLALQLCMLPLIAVFIWIAGGRELMAVRVRHGLPPFGKGGGAPPFSPQAEWDVGPSPTEPGSTGARRPTSWEPGPGEPHGGHRGGFTEQTIRALERYHGRLRRERGSD